MRSVNIGIIGLGTVGGGVVRLIQRHHDDYVEHYGIDLQIKRACSRNDAEAKNLGIADIFTTNWQDVTSDPTIDIVIELIGGEHPATEIFEDSFAHGKHVVSANKALLGRHVEHLAKLANSHGVQIKCEAAAAGGIPVVSALEHDLVGNEILTIAGIMNGTTNYILSRMANEGLGFDEVLADAQRLGYAEDEPTADVDGFDAASKIAILASIGFRTRVNTDDVFIQGIRNVSATDIEMARQFGYAIKLLAIARNTESGVDVRVHPTMIPATHQLASVSGAMNAVFIVGFGELPDQVFSALCAACAGIGMPNPVIVDASLVGDPARATFVVEALDPAAIIVADGIAAAMLSDGYHAKLPLNAATRLLGRPFVAFESFQGDLSDDKLKQRDWALIKTLKRA